MGLMKIAYISEPGKIDICEVKIPVPREDEALLKIKYCGICGSDVATYTGNQPFATYPRIPGHEFSAEIVEVGKNKQGLKPGMIVTANPYFNCGKCYSCLNGKVNCCEDNKTMGVQRDGSFAEYITMPVERIVDGQGLSESTLALIEPFSISYHAINRGNIQSNDKVLVIGAGPIGIFAVIAAKMHGATVFATDLLEKRLALAQQMGANKVINGSVENLTEKIKELTNNDGMDVCVEAAGLPQTFLECVNNVCFGGKIILIGNGKRETTFNHSILSKKELDVYGSRNSLNDFAPLIEIVSWGKLDIDRLITNIYEFDQVSEAFQALTHNDGSMGKVLVKFT